MARTLDRQLTREEAIEVYESGEWKLWTPRERAEFQLFQDKLCMPFDVFHEAVQESLGRPVWTHELGRNRDGLVAEFRGLAEKPSMQDIVGMIPSDKLIVVTTGDTDDNAE